jgi:hypothetical protein
MLSIFVGNEGNSSQLVATSRRPTHLTFGPSVFILSFTVKIITMSEEPKVALITGITGQDGSYLAEFLLEKGYVVSPNTQISFVMTFLDIQYP